MAPLARRERVAMLAGSTPAWPGMVRASKEARDHGGGDRTTLAGVVVVGVEGCGGRSLMVIEVDDPACDSTHGAGGWLSVSGMCQLFAFDSVLLCGESEGGEGCSQ
jgi:hypothetical protein